ncbi:MAG: hypothetical protein KKB50_10980 [Planctomycetes bacterium]|nr:hypothetical protein [Planctomycetota bacterium]
MACSFGLVYPLWNHTAEPGSLLERAIGEVGIDHVTIPAVTGAISQFRLGLDEQKPLFHTEGGWHFPPNVPLYGGGQVRPHTARWIGKRDLLASVCEQAAAHNLAVHFRLDLRSVQSLIADAPHVRPRNAWGQDIPAAPPCVLNPDLRELLRATIEDLGRYAPSGFQLCNWAVDSLAEYPDIGMRTEDQHVLHDLLGMCFCAACRDQAAAGLDAEQVARSVRVHVEQLLARPADPELPGRIAEDESLLAYVEQRGDSVRHGLERLQAAHAESQLYAVLEPDSDDTPNTGAEVWTPLLHLSTGLLQYYLHQAPEEDEVGWDLAPAVAMPVWFPAFRESAALVRFVTSRTEGGAEFFDFEGLEEAPPEALQWLKQAVRYARRAHAPPR